MEKGRITYTFLLICVISIINFTVTLFSLDFILSGTYNFGDYLFSLYNSHNNLSIQFLDLNAMLGYTAENFSFVASLSALNDKVYNDPFSQGYYAGFYFLIKDAYVKMRVNSFTITFGKTNLGDMVSSPYSLFISTIHVPRNTLEYRYEGENFIYITRWIELNNILSTENQSEKYRSANYKVYAIKNNNLQFGYQEINVYVGKNFDFEYFANPIPGFFVQYVNKAGRPYPEGLGETNYMIGFYSSYLDKEKYIYGQILVDDINMNRFLKPDGSQNPDKLAWSFGGKFSTAYGEFGIYNAGATKYTFQPSSESGNKIYYGYTYFTNFTYSVSGKNIIYPLEMLYAGYMYGENNIALLFNYVPKQIKNLNASLEYVVLGERSPINPWNESSTFVEGTHLLDDPVLEKRLIGIVKYSFELFDFIKASVSSSLGYIWNKSELVEVNSDNVKKPIMRPLEGNNAPYFSLSLNLSISYQF
ncbi:MAG: hypothetical protein ACP5JS_04215 [Fervidobacterium sp.]